MTVMYSSSAFLHATIKNCFQSRLQHNDEEKLVILEGQLKLAKDENESLKKFVSEISEQHRLISLDLKAWFLHEGITWFLVFSKCFFRGFKS